MKYESPNSSGWEVTAKVDFLKSRLNIKVKVTRSKILVLMERSCHKEFTYEIPTCSG